MRYFAYGCNMSFDEVQQWCPSARFVARAKLKDFRVDFTRYSERRAGGVADIVPSEGEVVWGVLYDIPPAEMKKLDLKEGVPVGAYERQTVRVDTKDETQVKASTYSVVQEEGPYPPSGGYLDLMVAGARQWGLPADYVARLESLGRVGSGSG